MRSATIFLVEAEMAETIAARLGVEEGEIRNQENGHRGEPDDARLAKWRAACAQEEKR